MIWVVKGDESHNIISSNVFENIDDVNKPMYEVWVTRPNGKNLKVFEHEDKAEAKLLKEAIDYAISEGLKTFTIY